MSAVIAQDHWVELDDRAADGLEVRLWWSRATGEVKVTVDDVDQPARAEVHVSREDALDAFHHPFAYLRSATSGAAQRRHIPLPS